MKLGFVASVVGTSASPAPRVLPRTQRPGEHVDSQEKKTIGPSCPRVPHSPMQPTGIKGIQEKSYILADVYYVVNSIMVTSVLRTDFFFLSLFPNSTVY